MPWLARWLPSGRRVAIGTTVVVVGVAGLSALLVPHRDQLEGSVFGLLLLVPTVLGTTVGGAPAAVIGVVGGFATYNFLFTQPYHTFAVHSSADAVGLAVYVLVGSVLALIVGQEQQALRLAAEREEEAARARILAEVDRLRSALVGAVSHDLRTPLSSIGAAASDLRDPAVTLSGGQRAALLDTIAAEARRLDRLVRNLLDVGRIESGSLVAETVPVEFDELLGEARALAHVDRRELAVDVPGDLPPLEVDPVLAVQVLVNLLENADQYAPPGDLIRVSARAVERWVEVAVADHGPGIASADRQRVFERYYQVERGNGQRGTGMGLTVCRGSVEAHGGRIWAEETPGGGATVVFRLPMSDVDVEGPRV